MQDFHLFRQFEFHKCVTDLQIPCRWAPDSGFGYGVPIFNFYTQAPYVLGEAFHLLGFQIIDSIKILFSLSLIGSGIAMYYLAKQIWANDNAAILSSILYIYAPYRAVDVWVRGALPEALAFVLFPLISLFLYKFIQKNKVKDLLLFSLTLALLLLTHNLSLLMFLPFLWIVTVVYILRNKKFNLIPPLLLAGLGAILLSAFYLIPVAFEGKFINISSTTQGYYDFRGHFAGIYQLLVSRYWGYGASLFGPDDRLSLSVGHFQWILPLLSLVFAFIFKNKSFKKILLLTFLGWIALFLTHNKSAFLWEVVKPMWYIQFPWRFLSVAVFFFSLAGGVLVLVLNKWKYSLWLVIVGVILWNLPFFKEDIWFQISDKKQFSGPRWEEQKAASVGDYWPNFGNKLPSAPAPSQPLVENVAVGEELIKKTNLAKYKISLDKESDVLFPIAYFPGWTSNLGKVYPSGDLGLSTIKLPAGRDQKVVLKFINTPVRTLGNTLTLAALIVAGLLAKRYGH